MNFIATQVFAWYDRIATWTYIIEEIQMKPANKLSSAETYFQSGNKKSELGDYSGSIIDYDAAIDLKPDFAYVYYNRGIAKDKLGKICDAESDFQIAGDLAKQTGDVALKITIEQRLRLSRITLNPQQCGGRPCIRGMRIRVTDVLGLLASGLSFNEILEEMPDLESEDILACLQFAANKMDVPILTA